MRFTYSLFLIVLACLSVHVRAINLDDPEVPSQTYYCITGKPNSCGSTKDQSCQNGGWAGWNLAGYGVCSYIYQPTGNPAPGSENPVAVSCPAGMAFDDNAGECLAIEEPPECPGSETLQTFNIGGVKQWICVEPLPPPPNCLVIGYTSSGEEICVPNEEPEECLQAGGTYSITNGLSSCILGQPENPPPPPEVPECGSGQLLMTNSSGGFSCYQMFFDPPNLSGTGTGQGPGAGSGGGGDGGGPFAPPPVVHPPSCEGADCGPSGCEGPDCIIEVVTTECEGPDCNTEGVCVGANCTTTRTTESCTGTDCGAGGSCEGPNCTEIEECTGPDCGEGGECLEGDDCTVGPKTETIEECVGDDCEQGIQGGGNCAAESQPTCTGREPILCAIAIQTWKTRCALEETGEVTGESCNVDLDCEGDAIACYLAQEAKARRCYTEPLDDPSELISGESEPADLDLGDEDLTTILNNIFNQPASNANCPAPDQLSVAGATLEIEYTPFCNFGDMIRPVVLFFFGLLAFRITMRAF